MGIGVLDMVEMYASSVCDTHTILPKDPVESPSSCRGTKRRSSTACSEDSGRPRSPRTPKSSRSYRSDRFASSSTSSPDRDSSKRYSILSPTSYLTTAASTDTEDEEIVKRSRLERSPAPSSSSSSLHSSSSRLRESYESRRRRFLRTAEALRHSGLLDVTMKTAELLRKNQELQKEIENLQRETRSFVTSVLTNPENRPVLDNIRSQSQLYEIVVPGSEGIMSVTSSASLPEHNICLRNSLSEGDSDSLDSNDNDGVSSPSPAPTESSDGTSSLSEDSDSSEKENLTPPPSVTSSNVKR